MTVAPTTPRKCSAPSHETIGESICISHSLRNFGSQSAFRSGYGDHDQERLRAPGRRPSRSSRKLIRAVRRALAAKGTIHGLRPSRAAWGVVADAVQLQGFLSRFRLLLLHPDTPRRRRLLAHGRAVVRAILRFPERDLFLRGVRAVFGFKQTGVDTLRPERLFGKSTNNLLKNIGWAKKGILSFSNTPLNIMSFARAWFCGRPESRLGRASDRGPAAFPSARAARPHEHPGLILLFELLNLLGVSILGEYLAKIFEVKRRPHFVRRCEIRNGEVRSEFEDLNANGSAINASHD